MKLGRIEAIRYYKGLLCGMGMEENEAEAEAKHALSAIIGCDISDLYLKGTEQVTDNQQFRMNELLKEREKGTPLAYILNERWFMGLRFYVDENVLIPRQETELLAETAIQLMRFKSYSTVLDLCTGSGCVAISIAKYSRAAVSAADISSAALDVAKKNARDLGVNIRLIEGDLFENIPERFDIITANPPYIAQNVYEGLMREVREHEPRLALVAPDNGLAFYRRIAAQAGAHLNDGGTLLMEIGDEQGEAVSRILQDAGFRDVRITKDYSGNDRLASAVL